MSTVAANHDRAEDDEEFASAEWCPWCRADHCSVCAATPPELPHDPKCDYAAGSAPVTGTGDEK